MRAEHGTGADARQSRRQGRAAFPVGTDPSHSGTGPSSNLAIYDVQNLEGYYLATFPVYAASSEGTAIRGGVCPLERVQAGGDFSRSVHTSHKPDASKAGQHVVDR